MGVWVWGGIHKNQLVMCMTMFLCCFVVLLFGHQQNIAATDTNSSIFSPQTSTPSRLLDVHHSVLFVLLLSGQQNILATETAKYSHCRKIPFAGCQTPISKPHGPAHLHTD